MSTCSKLYSILKSPDKLKIPSVDSNTDNDFVVPSKRLNTEGVLWQCWECGRSYETGFRLSEHLHNCKKDDEVYEQLPGCPFCPRVINQSNDAPFHIHSFNTHVHRFHPEVKSYMCSYCMDTIHSYKIEDLVSHIINTHKIPWRPSPASLAHLRENQLPHRVVTCLGCGWCTFVLRANNAAQPPTSLEAHMNRCSFNGGQVHLTHLSEETCLSTLEMYKALQESKMISTTFAQSFPHVRGFIGNSGLSNSPFRFHRYSGGAASRAADMKLSSTGNKTNCLSLDLSNNNTKSSSAAATTTILKQKSKLETVLEKKDFHPKETFFDIPLTIPPPPTSRASIRKKSATPGRLFVCPLCGDNALASLRERDEHLQSSHNGELVFPCQICGMAYPLYIALRRHAALQHDSDFDTVRYGPSDLLECEPIECPECHLVAFQDSLVLKLHINLVHKKLSQNVIVTPVDSQSVEDSEIPSKPKISKTKVIPSNKKKPVSTTARRRHIANRPRTQSKNKTKGKTKLPVIGSKSDNDGNSLRSSNDIPLQKTATTVEFERMLSAIDGSPAAASCRYCHLEVDNMKELHLHLELEHINPDSDIAQLGCQECGRVFFGSGSKIDVIGHVHALHHRDFIRNVLPCPRVEVLGGQSTLNGSIENECGKSCKAHFSSPRLRQLHISMTSTTSNPSEFTCPIQLNVEDYSSPEQIKKLVLETEIVADRSGIMVLAYCCPNCSRLFAGDNVVARFELHRSTCEEITTTTKSDNTEESMHPMESDPSCVSNADSTETTELHSSTVDLPLEFSETMKTSDERVTESQVT
ncbi:Zinc finger C2H2 [Schistosoma japonicum]|nr:Zinc finger C2H2 [Schistosoma japonicum]